MIQAPEGGARSISKIVFILTFGTSIQWFNFFIAAVAAAIVWPSVFFSPNEPISGISLSVVAYAIAFVTRPVGGILFGYIGDKFGRKSSFVGAIFLMALGTLAIALTPSYAAIGQLASLLLVSFRAIQGLGVGGQWGGATTYVSELTAGSRWRVFWTGWVQASLSVGIALATFVMAMSSSLLPSRIFLDLGWRAIFILGALLVTIGGVMNYRLRESPFFSKSRARGERDGFSILQAFRNHWRTILRLALIEEYEVGTSSIVVLPLSITYISALNVSNSTAMLSVTTGAIFAIVVVVVVAIMSSRLGTKRPILAASTALSAIILAYPYLALLRSDNLVLILISQMLLYGSLESGYSVLASLYAEEFPTKYRNTGVGVSYQISAAISGLLNLSLVFYLLRTSNGVTSAMPQIVMVAAALCVISFLVTVMSKETKELPA